MCDEPGRAPPHTEWHWPDRPTMLNWTTDKASADTATSRPITILASWLVCKGQRPTQHKYPNHSVLLACGDEQRLAIESDPVAPSRGLTTRAQNAWSCHVENLLVLYGPARLSHQLAGTPQGRPNFNNGLKQSQGNHVSKHQGENPRNHPQWIPLNVIIKVNVRIFLLI